MTGRRIGAGLAFAGCVVGAIYAAMMLGCYVHEIVGHGGGAALVGGRFRRFDVDPAAHGSTFFEQVPPRLEWIPWYGGIGVNLICGLVAVALTRRRRNVAGHKTLALLAVGVTHTGQALGYSIQGALSGHGDAGELKTRLAAGPRTAVVAALVVGYLLLLDWTLRGIVRLVDAQFAPRDVRARRRWFAATVVLPFAALAVARPPSTIFSAAVDWGSRAALVLAVGGWGAWRCAGVAPDAAPRRPFGGLGAAAWLFLAGGLAVLAAVWTSRGVWVG